MYPDHSHPDMSCCCLRYTSYTGSSKYTAMHVYISLILLDVLVTTGYSTYAMLYIAGCVVCGNVHGTVQDLLGRLTWVSRAMPP